MFARIHSFSLDEFIVFVFLFLVFTFGVLYPPEILKRIYYKTFYIMRGPLVVVCALSVLAICVSYFRVSFLGWF